MSTIQFTKMVALGNDFMVVAAKSDADWLTANTIARLGDRKLGVGFDQLLTLSPVHPKPATFTYGIFNQDGSKVQQCGNGARAVALFALKAGWVGPQDIITLRTEKSVMTASIVDATQVMVTMGKPKQVQLGNALVWEGNEIHYDFIDVGNPHMIIWCDAFIKEATMTAMGEALQSYPIFPEGINISWVRKNNKDLFRLKTFERGAGLTAACGSAATAAMVAGRKNQLCDKTVLMEMPGGSLLLSWADENSPVKQKGQADFVFEGSVTL